MPKEVTHLLCLAKLAFQVENISVMTTVNKSKTIESVAARERTHTQAMILLRTFCFWSKTARQINGTGSEVEKSKGVGRVKTCLIYTVVCKLLCSQSILIQLEDDMCSRLQAFKPFWRTWKSTAHAESDSVSKNTRWRSLEVWTDFFIIGGDRSELPHISHSPHDKYHSSMCKK